MEYLITGRFGRITKNIINNGFEEYLDNILYDSMEFPKMNKKQKAEYIQLVIIRMEKYIGKDNTLKVLNSCGKQCCGKSWTTFAKDIWDETKELTRFFEFLNIREKAYNTEFVYNKEKNTIIINRGKCLCGLVEKAQFKYDTGRYCECSTGHFKEFFEAIFSVEDISIKQSILYGADCCTWEVKLKEKGRTLKYEHNSCW
jgi:hypothetical protein